MPKTKSAAPQASKSQKTSGITAEIDPVADPLASKLRKPLEIDEPELASADEKPEDDAPAVEGEEADALAEEASLDDEELNPFGDKWEQ